MTAFVDPLSNRYCYSEKKERRKFSDEVMRYVRVSERELHAQQDDKDGIKVLFSQVVKFRKKKLSQQKKLKMASNKTFTIQKNQLNLTAAAVCHRCLLCSGCI